jgi:hypothetical protein
VWGKRALLTWRRRRRGCGSMRRGLRSVSRVRVRSALQVGLVSAAGRFSQRCRQVELTEARCR